MLVLTRKTDETIVIGDGNNSIKVTVVGVKGDKVRLGITAPECVPVHRREVYEAIKRGDQAAKNVASLDSSLVEPHT